MQTLDVISVNIWHILISLANLLIMFLILKKFLFGPVKRIFSERSEMIQDKYDQAEQAKQNALRDERCYSEKLAHADEEADTILRQARDKADKMETEILDKANAKAEAIYRRAEAEIAQEKKKAVNEIKDEIASVSVNLAESMIGREIKEEDHRELIDGFISEIGE